ncbi:MAG TPA: hypothetical protein VE196_07305 [Pseudonocardiaceae bacterium]|nr:hypothetical protein [Pseudonocardiaceae bacterium]
MDTRSSSRQSRNDASSTSALSRAELAPQQPARQSSSLSRLGVAGEPVPERLDTAEVAEDLLSALRRANGAVDLVAALADHPCDDVPLSTLSRSLHSASEVVRALRNAEWQVLDRLPTLRHPDAVGVRYTLRTGAASNEIAAPLAKVLTDAKNRTLQPIVAWEPPARRNQLQRPYLHRPGLTVPPDHPAHDRGPQAAPRPRHRPATADPRPRPRAVHNALTSRNITA